MNENIGCAGNITKVLGMIAGDNVMTESKEWNAKGTAV
jgi:hypothetical protein